MRTLVWITTRFPAFHRWKDAPDEVSYLRKWHRHLFYVKLKKGVGHGNRDIEFIQLKEEVEQFLRNELEGKRFEMSCEHIAEVLLEAFEADEVEVSEDGENGAIVIAERDEKSCDGVSEDVGSRVYSDDANYCWVGIEAEGPHRGKKVLFVPGRMEYAGVKRALKKCSDLDRVYVGAKYDRNPAARLLHAVLLKAERMGLGVDVEVDSPKGLEAAMEMRSRGMEFTLIYVRNYLSSAPVSDIRIDYLKTIVGNRIEWTLVGDDDVKYATDLNDPLFARDERIG